ncbi:MAG TPA: efflux RND transporter periplasmic adaptor subunit [Candidatus Polarisedimenticolaceae bacterium]|nr:efflux RND transporter periplasmic adaptor subunit [Candidatus Polarisedimenticolaceae bacterium]
MSRVVKVVLGVGIVAGLGVGGYTWLQGREPDKNGLENVTIARGSIIEKAIAVGQIEPRQKYTVKSKISGIVKRCAFEVGDHVAAGDPLFEIVPDPTPTELVEGERRLESAQTSFNRAEADWSRASELARQGILSKDLLDQKRESFEKARIDLAGAQDNLELIRKGRVSGRGQDVESVIRAPVAGIVLERKVNPGDPVVPLTSYQAGTDLAVIADMSDLVFKGTVDEIDVGKLGSGVPARLKVGALPKETITGKLMRIAPQAKTVEGARLFEVEIELDAVQPVLLRAGYSANADLVIREKQDVLIVPERLLLFEQDGAHTFVEIPPAIAGGEPRKVEIKTGLSDGLNVEVVEGLKEGDVVIQRPPRDILG